MGGVFVLRKNLVLLICKMVIDIISNQERVKNRTSNLQTSIDP